MSVFRFNIVNLVLVCGCITMQRGSLTGTFYEHNMAAFPRFAVSHVIAIVVPSVYVMCVCAKCSNGTMWGYLFGKMPGVNDPDVARHLNANASNVMFTIAAGLVWFGLVWYAELQLLSRMFSNNIPLSFLLRCLSLDE